MTTDTKDLHKVLDLRTQGTQVKTDATRTSVETTRCWFKTQLPEVKAQVESGSCGKTETSINEVQPLKSSTG
jgi:hypothetical protein